MDYIYKHYNRKISDEELLGDLKTVAKTLGKKSISGMEYTKHGRYHDCTLKARFGSWTKAVTLAGLIPLRRERVSKGDLIYDLKEAARKAGKDSLTTTEYESLGSYSHRKYIFVWGAWNASLRAAGLQPTKTGKRANEELMANLKFVWDSLGKQPSARDMEKHSRISVTTYRKRYGSWQNALKEFVESAISNNKTNCISRVSRFAEDSAERKTGQSPLAGDSTRTGKNCYSRVSRFAEDSAERKTGQSPLTGDSARTGKNCYRRVSRFAEDSAERKTGQSPLAGDSARTGKNCNSRVSRFTEDSAEKKETGQSPLAGDSTRTNSEGVYVHKTSRYISVYLRYKVLLRDSFRCALCGRSPANEIGVVLHVDHKIPWSEGGETEYDNLRALCKECNLGRNVTQFYDCGEQTSPK